MIAKVLCALALSASVVVPVEEPPAYYVNIPAVHQVDCGRGSGTAFEAGGHMISVAHVTTLGDCKIGGRAFAHREEEGDFSLIDLPARGFRINCGGYKAGDYYFAVGFARGLPIQRLIVLQGTGQYAPNGLALLWGYPTVIPGMSGGVIFNSQGEAVGTVNMYSPVFPISLSRPLSDTSVCKGERG